MHMKRTNKRAIHESESNTQPECESHGLFCATFTVPINKLKNAYFKFKSTNRQRNEMSNIIVVRSATTTKSEQEKKRLALIENLIERERKSQRKSKNHFIWLGKSAVERKLFRITCGKMELQRWKQSVSVYVSKAEIAVCCYCCCCERLFEPVVNSISGIRIVRFSPGNIVYCNRRARNTNRVIYLPLQHKI